LDFWVQSYLFSQRYNEEQFSDQIVGEVSNNGTAPAEYAEITVSFYDANGQIVGTEFTYADPSTIAPGEKSSFTVLISGDTIPNQAQTYDITLQWNDQDFNEFSERGTGQPEAQEEQSSEDNGSGDGGSGDGGGSDDGGSGDGGGSDEEPL
jgi:hypothetical protein